MSILVSHLNLYPSLWQYFTGRGQMWTSAAEGFFFVSGIMIGLIRGREYLNTKLSAVSVKILKRAFQLYVCFVVFCVISMLISMVLIKFNLINASIGSVLQARDFNRSLWSIMQFRYYYGWADFLQFYVIYLIISIPLLWLLKRKMWYVVIELGVLAWFIPRIINIPVYSAFFYWGAFFIIGSAVGYHYENIKDYYKSLGNLTKKLITILPLSILAITVVLNWLVNFSDRPKNLNPESVIKVFTHYKWTLTTFTENYLYMNRTGVLRLPIFFIFAIGIFILFKKLEPFIEKHLDWLLGEFGRNSLRSYLVGGLMTSVFRYWVHDTTFIYNTLLSAFYIFLILKLTLSKFIQKYVPK